MEKDHQIKRNIETAESTLRKMQELVSDLSADMSISKGLAIQLKQLGERIRFLTEHQPETDEEWNVLEKAMADYDRISSVLERILAESDSEGNKLAELQKELDSLDL